MFKKIAILAAILPVAAAAQNVSGAMVFYSGTLTTDVTAGPLAQTVTLRLNGVNTSFPGTIVTGTTTYLEGSPFTILSQRSTPFAANFSSLYVVAESNDFTGVAGRRTVPMLANGTISNGVGYATEYLQRLTLLYPPFTIGNMSFKNGLIATITIPLPTSPKTGNVVTYSIPLPTGATTTFGTAKFPIGSPSATYFNFLAQGIGYVDIIGDGTIPNLPISGNYQGPGVVFTTGSLTISAHN